MALFRTAASLISQLILNVSGEYYSYLVFNLFSFHVLSRLLKLRVVVKGLHDKM